MERDDLRETWAALGNQLEKTQRLNDLLVTQSMTRGAQTAIAAERRWLAFEIVTNYAGVIALGWFASAHGQSRATIVSAAILAAALILVNGLLIGIAFGLGRLDYDEPVLALQTALERIALRRATLTACILLAGPLLWTPLFVVFVAFIGLDPMRVLGVPYLAANLACGMLVAAAGWTAARLFGSRVRASRWFSGAVDALSGGSYRRASDFLDTLERFRVTS